jgi:hypothetical protein
MVTSRAAGFVTACAAAGRGTAFNADRMPRRGAGALPEPRIPVHCRLPPSRLAGVALAALAALARPAAAASPEELADIDAKTEYAFFTEDARALDRLLAGAAALATSNRPLERYQYAHAQFRRLQLAARRDRPKEASAAAGACFAAVEAAEATDPRMAEAFVLDAACAGYAAARGGLWAGNARHRADSKLATARELAPSSPRLLLVDGLLHRFEPGGGAAAHRAARASLEAATRAFDTATGRDPGQPSWGEAESWLFLGRTLEEDGDVLGARNAYEKSLLAAPEFAAARRRLAALNAAR